MDIAQIIPPGGQWQAVVDEGAVTRSVIWPGRFGTAGRSRTVVAKINPLGDLDDASEGVLTMDTGWIVLAAHDGDGNLVLVKSAKVGGAEGVKAGVSYRLAADGRFVAVED